MKLHANIGIGHENDIELLKSRVVSAAQCNADAVVINKSTPALVIPEEKKYVPVPSKWGTKAYIDVARLSELSVENAQEISSFCEHIGIPLVWSVTDSEALLFVQEHCKAKTVKLHYDAVDAENLIRYCVDSVPYTWVSHIHLDTVNTYYKKRTRMYGLYYTTKSFPPDVDDMQLAHIDKLAFAGHTVAYESREAGIFPAIAVAYKKVDHIEKYLGEEQSDHTSILTPAQMYDMFNSLEILTRANSIPTD